MKANPWLLPGAALLVTGGWIASQKNSSASLEREITVLTERIHQARALAGGQEAAAGTAAKTGKDKDGKVDWKNIAGKMAQARGGGGMGDMRSFVRVQKLLLEMSAEELCAQLDEIKALDLDDAVGRQLRGMILGALAEKDPKLVIERYGNEAGDENQWHLSQALRKWATTEPAAAAAWLDAQIAAGTFESKSLDGKNQARLRFEGTLVSELIKTDPAAASARVAALPEDQRVDFFQQGFFFQVTPETSAAYAGLVRDNLPADKVGGVLASTARTLAMQGGFERVDGFIASANATDDEKKAIVGEVMNQKLFDNRKGEINEESIEKARAWAATQSPGSVDSATGRALGDALWRSGDFDKISSLVLKYNESGTNDDVLGEFLKSNAARHRSPGEAKALISQIEDPALREEISALPEYKNQSSEP